MALHPLNDRIKIKRDEPERFGEATVSAETGVVVEVPDVLIYFSFHSFAFEDSFMSEEKLKRIQEYYNKLMGKRVYWEKLQDRGRIFEEEDGQYVYLQMTDVLAVADDVNDKATVVEQTGAAGSFNL